MNVQLFEPNKYICERACNHNSVDIETAQMALEQKYLSNEIEDIYQSFDSELKTVNDARYEIALDLKFMELYYLTVYQELMLFNQFEEPQKLLLEAIGDLTVKGRQIEREIEIKKIPLKRWIELENEDWTNEAAIEMCALFKLSG